MLTRVAAIVTEGVLLAASHTLAARTFADFWRRVSPKLREGVDYVDKHDSDALEANKTFLEIITLRDPEITRVVNSCLRDFVSGPTMTVVSAIDRVLSRLEERRQRINNWRLALLSAPESSLLPLRLTRGALRRRERRERAAIARDEALVARLKAEALSKFEADGVPISAAQLDGLLYSAEGSDIARLMCCAENIKGIERRLTEALGSKEADGRQSKTYAGFLMMSYRVYLAAIDRALAAIENDYLARLDDIKQGAAEQMVLAERLIGKARKAAAVARNNLELNRHTIEIAERYEAHLLNRRDRLSKLRREMRVNFELAVNTFRTVKVGGELIAVMKSGERDLGRIFEFEAPDFSAVCDAGLRAEFEAMTRQLRSA